MRALDERIDPEESYWCIEHVCESDECPVDEVMCELITMSDKHRNERDDYAYDEWNDDHFDR